MKTRKGFVSNSSSSSFICDISGTAESVMDGWLRDVGMIECENGHTFLYLDYPEVESFADGNYEPKEGDNEDLEEDILPARLCPICNGDLETKAKITERIMNDMKHCNITVDDLK